MSLTVSFSALSTSTSSYFNSVTGYVAQRIYFMNFSCTIAQLVVQLSDSQGVSVFMPT